jgi:polyketide cyclase/dehydrase/lipid transport protein
VSDGNPIRWPAEHRPEVSRFLAVNELQTDAGPEEVFAWLCRPNLWPSFYGNARLVKHLEGPWPRVELGSRFRWLTFGALITSEIVEFDPPERLAWSASGLGSRGHHAWYLRRQARGTFIHTEETQRGWGIAIVKPALRALMVRQHQRWLEGLAEAAAKGPPPP